MAAAIAWLELRQQLRGRVFAIVFFISALMVAGAEAIDTLRVGLDGAGEAGGAATVLRVHQVWTLFYLFTAAAFVADAALRDELAGMADMIRATPASRTGYLLGRFAGGFAAVLLCFVSVPATLWASGLLGGTLAPAGAYLFAFFGLAAPNLLLGCALTFGLATATRSMTGCLLGAVALLTLYGLGAEVGAMWEPFGFAAVGEATRGWSAARLAADWPGMEGALLANRALWLGVAVLFIIAGRIGLRRERARRPGAFVVGRETVEPPVERADGGTLDPERTPDKQQFSGALVWAQVRMRTVLELRLVVLTPAFAVLLLLGLAHAGAALWRTPEPDTAGLVLALNAAFRLAPVVTAVFFAGELYWGEREHRMDGLIAAAPVEAPALVAPKLAALALALLGLAVATAAAGAAVELLRGGAPDWGRWLAWYLLPRWFDWLLIGMLAMFLQAVAPNKLAGWGLMVLYLILSMALDRLGWTDPIYRYGLYPGSPLPPALSGAEGAGAYRLYWAVVAGLLAAWACGRSPVRRERGAGKVSRLPAAVEN